MLLAFVRAAAEACDLGADLAKRATRLFEIAQKLRARGSARVIKLLPDDDTMAPVEREPVERSACSNDCSNRALCATQRSADFRSTGCDNDPTRKAPPKPGVSSI